MFMTTSPPPEPPVDTTHPVMAHRWRMYLVMRETISTIYLKHRLAGESFDGLVIALFDGGDPMGASALSAMGIDLRQVGNEVAAVLIERAALVDLLGHAYGAEATAALRDLAPQATLDVVAVFSGYTQFKVPMGTLPFLAPGGDA